MTRFCKSISLSLAAAALFSACSRPVATFQAAKPIHYYSQQATPTAVVSDTPAVALAEPSEQPVSEASKPDEPAARALVSLKATYATDQRMTRRLERVASQLADSRRTPTAATAQKTTLMQRVLLKKMAKKMERQLAPNQPKEITGTARLGLIIAGVGLLLLLIGNGVGSILGLIALLAGGALFVYSLLQE